MQTRQFLFVLGTAVAVALPSSSLAQTESDADKALREALRKQVEDYRANPTAPAASHAAPAKPAPAPKVETVVVPVPEEPAPAPAAPVKSDTTKAAGGPVFSEVPDEKTSKSQEAMTEALRKQLAAEKAAKAAAAPVTATTVPATTASKPAATPSQPTAPPPARPAATAPEVNQNTSILAGMEAPPAPVNATKQQQLADLLVRYKLDQISSQEYQTERAKIIGK